MTSGGCDSPACLCECETLRQTVARLERELALVRTAERVTTDHLERQTRRAQQLERRLARIWQAAQDE